MSNIKKTKKTSGFHKKKSRATSGTPMDFKKGKNDKKSGKSVAKLSGRIDGTRKGYAFFVPDGGGEDLFIAERNLFGALNGDLVQVKSTRAGEAEVVTIVERKNNTIVGTLKTTGTKSGIVVADDIRLGSDIHVTFERLNGARNGDKVVVEILSYEHMRMPEGAVIEVLGKEGEQNVDILSILRSYELYEDFPKGVLKQAQETATEVSEEQIKGRKDFRDDLVITIDGDDSKDFDDAVCVKPIEGGGYKLYVHIADVAHYVPAQSKLDIEALKRGTSVYYLNKVLPMLPPLLSNGICSLNEGQNRLTLSCVMTFNSTGEIVKSKIIEGVIASSARMTYGNVSAILQGDEELTLKYSALVPMLQDMQKLAKVLYNRRLKRGSVEFDLPECAILLDEDGKVTDIKRKPRLVAHHIIEEFMLAANETVARRFESLKLPFVYRVHDIPPTEKTDALIEFLSCLGITFPGKKEQPHPKDFSKLLESVSADLKEIVSRVTLRSMAKACYKPSNDGHFGLAAEYYCHFTSPIRRYPDLMIHRIIKAFLNGGEKAVEKYSGIVDDVSTQSSKRERLAELAERKIDDLKKAQFMMDKIGNEYDGMISGVTEWGFFVELDNSVEGMVKTESLSGGVYTFNPKLHRLFNSAQAYSLGDKVKIRVFAVNVDRVQFVLAENFMILNKDNVI